MRGLLLAIYGVSVKREGSLETPRAGTAIVRVLRLLAVSLRLACLELHTHP